MTETLLKFPCDFPIKAFGKAEGSPQAFVDLIFALVNPHVVNLQAHQLSLNESSKGRFVAVTVNIRATSQQQLDAIYQALSDHEQVVMSL